MYRRLVGPSLPLDFFHRGGLKARFVLQQPKSSTTLDRAVLETIAREQHAGVEPIGQGEHVGHRLGSEQAGLVDPNQLPGRLLLQLFIDEQAGHRVGLGEARLARRPPASIG